MKKKKGKSSPFFHCLLLLLLLQKLTFFFPFVLLTFSTDKFPRLRIGIGSDEGGGAGHVLSNFNGSEQKNLNKILDYTCSIVRVYLHRGFQAAARLANDPEWNVKYWEELRRKNMK